MGSHHSIHIVRTSCMQHLDDIDLDLDLSGARFIEQISDTHRIYKIGLNFKKIFHDDIRKLEALIYERQRPIDLIRASKIAEQVNSKPDYFWGSIYIGLIGNKHPALLDGQHRIMATQYCSDGQDYPALLHIVTFNSEDERFNYFVHLNSNTPVACSYLTTEDGYRDLGRKVVEMLHQRYPGQIRYGLHTKPWQIKEMDILSLVIELALHKSLEVTNFRFTDSFKVDEYATKLYELITGFNQYVSRLPISDSSFKPVVYVKNNWERATYSGFFLGLVDELYYSLKVYARENYGLVENQCEIRNLQIDSQCYQSQSCQSSDNESECTDSNLKIGETHEDNMSHTDEADPKDITFIEQQTGIMDTDIVVEPVANDATDYSAVLEHMRRIYGKTIRSSQNPRPPHYTQAKFNSVLTQMITQSLMCNKDPDGEIIALNGFLSTKPANYGYFYRPMRPTYIESAKKCGFYIGLVKPDLLHTLFDRHLQGLSM